MDRVVGRSVSCVHEKNVPAVIRKEGFHWSTYLSSLAAGRGRKRSIRLIEQPVGLGLTDIGPTTCGHGKRRSRAPRVRSFGLCQRFDDDDLFRRRSAEGALLSAYAAAGALFRENIRFRLRRGRPVTSVSEPQFTTGLGSRYCTIRSARSALRRAAQARAFPWSSTSVRRRPTPVGRLRDAQVPIHLRAWTRTKPRGSIAGRYGLLARRASSPDSTGRTQVGRPNLGGLSGTPGVSAPGA